MKDKFSNVSLLMIRELYTAYNLTKTSNPADIGRREIVEIWLIIVETSTRYDQRHSDVVLRTLIQQ